MAKTVTLRLDDEVYDLFVAAAKAENRPLSNLIETAALSRIREQRFVSASGSWTTSSSIRGVIIVFWKKARYS
jgi:predicted transcriptional regulator